MKNRGVSSHSQDEEPRTP